MGRGGGTEIAVVPCGLVRGGSDERGTEEQQAQNGECWLAHSENVRLQRALKRIWGIMGPATMGGSAVVVCTATMKAQLVDA